MKVLIIIPAYNEEQSIEKVVESVRAKCKDADFIVVNDGSSDGTSDICREKGYKILNLPVNLGLAGAFQTGIRYAYEHDYDVAVQIDGDGQHEPLFIDDMVKCMTEENADIVIGSRFVNKEKPFTARMLGSRLLSFAIKTTTGCKINDPTSGMRAYSKKMIGILAENINFGPEPDTIAFLIRNGAKIKEIQVEMYERETGKSYFTAGKSARYMINMFISIYFVQFFRRSI